MAFTLTAVAAVLLALPATASAERGDRNHRSDSKGGERHRVDEHEEGHAAHARHRHSRHAKARHAHFGWPWARHFSGHAAWRDRHHQVSRHSRHFVRHERQAREDRRERRAAKHAHRAGYYCKPCRNRFESRSDFRGHLHRAHRVPFRRLSRVIVSHALGWVYYG